MGFRAWLCHWLCPRRAPVDPEPVVPVDDEPPEALVEPLDRWTCECGKTYRVPTDRPLRVTCQACGHISIERT